MVQAVAYQREKMRWIPPPMGGLKLIRDMVM